MPDPLIPSIRQTIARVREIGAYGGDDEDDRAPDTIEVHWLQITSTTKVGEWYPAERYPANSDGDGFDSAAEACYLFPPNDEVLVENVFYPTHLFSNDVDSGYAIYALLVAGATEVVAAQITTQVDCINGDLYTMTFEDGELTDVTIEADCCTNSGSTNPNDTNCDSEYPFLGFSFTQDIDSDTVTAACLGLPAALDAEVCITYAGIEDDCAVWRYTGADFIVEVRNCDGIWNGCIHLQSTNPFGTYADVSRFCGFGVGGISGNCVPPTLAFTLTPDSSVGGGSFTALLDSCTTTAGNTTCCPSDTFPTTMTATITNKTGIGIYLPDSLTFTYNAAGCIISNSWCATHSHASICGGETIGFALWCAGPEYGACAGWQLVAVIPNVIGGGCSFVTGEGACIGALADSVTCATKTVVFNSVSLATTSDPPNCDCATASGTAVFTFTP